MRPEAGTPVQIAIDRDFRRSRQERARVDLERFLSVTDLHDHLEANGHLEACEHAFKCDPWKYEPILLEELIGELASDGNPERVNRLRKLIRAGSWMSYSRENPDDVSADLNAVRASEERSWESRIRHADPDTSKELREDMEGELKEFDFVVRAIESNSVGRDAEPATRAIDNLQARAWNALKRLLAVRDLSLDEAKRDHVTKPLIAEIERLRPVRDLLYYRRCYPGWAKLGK